MKITGFKLLKKGMAGIEVEGIDLVDAGNQRVVFTDGLKRTRKFPLSTAIRQAVQVLNYPFLVGTEHWDSQFAKYMYDDFRCPDKALYEPNDSMSKKLNSFWESAQIVACKVEVGSRYKITGEIYCDLCTIKATVVIEEASDSSLHSFVDEAIGNIMKLVQETLALPQLAISDPSQVRAIFKELSNPEDEDSIDDLDPDGQFLAMMTQARKKGFGIMLDDNSLAQFALDIPEEDQGEPADFSLEEHGGPIDQVADANKDFAIVASKETKEPSIFKGSISDVDPVYMPESGDEDYDPDELDPEEDTYVDHVLDEEVL